MTAHRPVAVGIAPVHVDSIASVAIDLAAHVRDLAAPTNVTVCFEAAADPASELARVADEVGAHEASFRHTVKKSSSAQSRSISPAINTDRSLSSR